MPPPENSLTLPVKYLVKRPPVFVEPGATVAQAARTMREALIGSVLVADDPPGIVTDRDLRGRVLAAGLIPETPVRQIMSRPLKTVDSDAPVFAALHLMLEENIHHLALVEEGKIIGLISSSDLLQHQASSPLYLRRTLVETLEQPASLAHYSREVAGMVETLFRGGLGAVQIGRVVSGLNDALVKRLVGLAERDLGPAPTAFAWIVFGSEGRLEQALLTDQDNALIYGDESEKARIYFAALAERVVDGLIQIGFPPCAGGFMATRWCKSLEDWRRLFAHWVRTPEPQALLDAAIFFDFRPVAGKLSLAPLDKILAGAGTEKAFIAHLAEGTLAHPPLGFFNQIRSDDGKVDVKKGGLAPIVGLARAAALAAGSLERSTLERLAAAGKSGILLSQNNASELAAIFQFLLHLRLRQQLASLQANRPLDHNVHLNALSTSERRHLKEGFVMIRRIQDGIRAWCSWEIVGW